MANTNADSGSESTSEQPNAVAAPTNDKPAEKPKEKGKPGVFAARVGSDSTSEQP